MKLSFISLSVFSPLQNARGSLLLGIFRGGRIRGFTAIFLFVFLARDPVDARQPAMEIDVGATLRAKRIVALHRGLAANRARRSGNDADFFLGHGLYIEPRVNVATNFYRRMIFSENRFTLFGIMRYCRLTQPK